MKVYELINLLLTAKAGAEVSFNVSCGDKNNPLFVTEFFIDTENDCVFELDGYAPYPMKRKKK